MARYIVVFYVTATAEVEVSADSKEEAKCLAEDIVEAKDAYAHEFIVDVVETLSD